MKLMIQHNTNKTLNKTHYILNPFTIFFPEQKGRISHLPCKVQQEIMLNTKKKTNHKKSQHRNRSISLSFDQFLNKMITEGNTKEQLFVTN